MTRLQRIVLLACSILIMGQPTYADWDDIELEDGALIRAINPKEKFKEQDKFNLYFSSKTPLYWKDTKIIENDRDYFLSLTEQLTANDNSINHLFVKIFCVYKDKKGKQHYIESVVLSKFHGFKKEDPGVSHYIGLSVTKNETDVAFNSKTYIDFSSSTGKKVIKKTSISDQEVSTLIYSGPKKNDEHSEDRFFKLEATSNAVDGKEKYRNSIFEQLLKKKGNLKKVKKVECFGVKFFSRYDACEKCQKLIMDQLTGDGGLREDFVNSLKALNLQSVVKEDVPFIPIYYSGRPYAKIQYAFYDTKKLHKGLKLESVKRTGSIDFKHKGQKIEPKQSFTTKGPKIDLSLGYLQGCMFSNIRTLYTQ